jgi:endonuclease/exonuclease/phosphatase (EEP) superfamily protein YafD
MGESRPPAADGGRGDRLPAAARIALLAVLLVLHGLYLVGDRTWWGEWISIWPPIGWLVLALPATFRLRSGWGLALALLLVALHTDRPRFGPEAQARRGSLRVVSWNVAGDPRSWGYLREVGADLIAVQESAGPPPEAWEGYEWHGTLDPGVLSRFPAEPLPTRRVGPWMEPQLLLVHPPERPPLIVANVRLVLPSIVTWVAGGATSSPVEGHAERVAQYQRLATLLAEARSTTGVGRVLVLGDFNAPARMPSLTPLERSYRDCWEQAGRGWGATATAALPIARIDHCWIAGPVEAVSVRVRRMPVSDHRMLVADLDLTG